LISLPLARVFPLARGATARGAQSAIEAEAPAVQRIGSGFLLGPFSLLMTTTVLADEEVN
jgi:hypothetical protein